MHRDMARDVVKNIGLRQIIQLVRSADRDGGGEFAIAQAVEKDKSRDISADCFGLKSGQRAQELIHIVQARHAIGAEAQRIDTLAEMIVGVLLPAWEHSGVQLMPSLVILLRIKLVRLTYVQLAVAASFFDKRSLGRGQTGGYSGGHARFPLVFDHTPKSTHKPVVLR